MADDAQALVLAELERAELLARERRLSAAAEAEAIVARAAVQVAEIESSAGERVAAAIATLRSEHLEHAERQIASMADELAQLEAHREHIVRDSRFEAAVESIVAAVLGEEVRAVRSPGPEDAGAGVALGTATPALVGGA